MQKVEGSSPFIRLRKPRKRGFLVAIESDVSPRTCPRSSVDYRSLTGQGDAYDDLAGCGGPRGEDGQGGPCARSRAVVLAEGRAVAPGRQMLSCRRGQFVVGRPAPATSGAVSPRQSKSLAADIVLLEAIRAEGGAILIDLEMGAASRRARLVDLGATSRSRRDRLRRSRGVPAGAQRPRVRPW